MKTQLDLKSVLLVQLCYLLQNVLSKHHCLACRHSDEDSQSQENYSDLEEIPIVSMESPVPISLPQVNSISMNLPQILTPQVSMPSMTMRAGSFHTSLLTGQNFVFFRIPSSYINIMKTILPSESTSTTAENPTLTNTTTAHTTTTTTTSEKPIHKLLRLANNSISDLENEEDSDGRPLISNTNNEDSMMESVLQNIMNDFSDRIIKTAENKNDFTRRRMMPTSLTKTQPTQDVPQFKILPIPDSIAKKLLSHLRAVKYISSSRKKRAAIFN